jgi:hypothetical protein
MFKVRAMVDGAVTGILSKTVDDGHGSLVECLLLQGDSEEKFTVIEIVNHSNHTIAGCLLQSNVHGSPDTREQK